MYGRRMKAAGAGCAEKRTHGCGGEQGWTEGLGGYKLWGKCNRYGWNGEQGFTGWRLVLLFL